MVRGLKCERQGRTRAAPCVIALSRELPWGTQACLAASRQPARKRKRPDDDGVGAPAAVRRWYVLARLYDGVPAAHPQLAHLRDARESHAAGQAQAWQCHAARPAEAPMTQSDANTWCAAVNAEEGRGALAPGRIPPTAVTGLRL